MRLSMKKRLGKPDFKEYLFDERRREDFFGCHE